MQEPITEQLEKATAPSELAQVLEAQLKDLIRLAAKAGEPITEQQAEGMQKVVELCDHLKCSGDE